MVRIDVQIKLLTQIKKLFKEGVLMHLYLHQKAVNLSQQNNREADGINKRFPLKLKGIPFTLQLVL